MKRSVQGREVRGNGGCGLMEQLKGRAGALHGKSATAHDRMADWQTYTCGFCRHAILPGKGGNRAREGEQLR